MIFKDWAKNQVLLFLATGRIARRGALFRLLPRKSLIALRSYPTERGSQELWYYFELTPRIKGSFLVLAVQEQTPLWEQWVKVLFASDQDDTMIGWLPYHEFNRLVRSEWDLWEDEES